MQLSNSISNYLSARRGLIRIPQTRLTGEDGCLDSLGLIDLITNTEKAASEESEHEYKR